MMGLCYSSVADPDLQIRERWGGGGGSHPDTEKRGVVSKDIFRPFGPQFALKIRGGAGPPDPSPGSATIVWSPHIR